MDFIVTLAQSIPAPEMTATANGLAWLWAVSKFSKIEADMQSIKTALNIQTKRKKNDS